MTETVTTPPLPSQRPPVRSTREWWDSQRLLGERGEIKIRHRGEIYSLRLTRTGKLILTK
jgi:hemin uptake protein HemP